MDICLKAALGSYFVHFGSRMGSIWGPDLVILEGVISTVLLGWHPQTMMPSPPESLLFRPQGRTTGGVEETKESRG